MTSVLPSPNITLSAEQEANFGGERVSHLFPNDCYYAHLSIYHFASRFMNHGLVLDAGAGSGYGAAWLADHGARFVHAIELSAEAVAFSEKYFQRPNLQFQVMDLQQIAGFDPRSFDLLYSSKVLEHVPDVRPFLRSASELLNADGMLVLAVPPITNWELEAHNLINPFHCNIWSPRQWYSVLERYFQTIQCYGHLGDKPGVTLDFGNHPANTVITEDDFRFDPLSADELMYRPTLTAIFVASVPRAPRDIPANDEQLTFVDDSYTLPLDQPAARLAMARRLFERSQSVQQILAPLINPDGAGGDEEHA